ncbi:MULTISPECIES: site-2 protease family protein [Methylosinus]|uniref:Zinc metalloprotease n=1 Tax=Methylosinus trichosporium (strain ATCC 35070 / NCIMB 11131 / UNIQEM 75 / OB3b) TaxID=595536 RepID=A0A2D2D4Q4_METT3|nr:MULTISPECIES: site-2 protease family protein [Methylosinus]ATQ69956.1 site-2 protease family protein [Methylosinus trichosporium OB3b]OBS51126.1 protease [Methylosinus sp. 3S-1]
MRWSITLGSFKGTAVRIHVTFILLLAWIGFSAYRSGGLEAARDSVLFILLIFTCVVLHEFGHILTARRFGIVSTEVTLLPIGGVANLAHMPEKPAQELLVAIAGPMVNIAIAIALFVALGTFHPEALTQLDDPQLGLVPRLAAANLFLAVFNMIPAFPMDGGRVLRAALALWLDRAKATRIAASIGQIFAFLLGFLGLFGNPLLVFIAIFVYMAAAGEAQMTVASEATRGLAVADAMETRIAAIDWGADLSEAVDILLATSQEEFPVVNGPRFMGLLGRADIIEALKSEARSAPIAPYVRRDPPTVDRDAPLDKTIESFGEAAAIGVLGEDGALVGLLTRQSLAEIVLIANLRPDWRLARRSRG